VFDSVLPDLSGLELPGVDPGALTGDPGTLISAVASLTADQVSSDAEVLDLVAAWDRIATWAVARSVAVTAEFARRPADSRLGEPGAARGPVGSVRRSHVDDELAVRLGSSRRSVAWRVELAVALATGLPTTGAAFNSGRLDAAKARVVVEECAAASPEAVTAVEAAVIDDRAYAQPAARLRDRVRRAVLVAAPEEAARRAERARAGRSVALTPLPDGMSELWAHLPAADAAAISTAVDAAARRLKAAPGETRGMEQLRADCLVAPFSNALRTGRLDGADPVTLLQVGGEPVAVQVTVPAAVLLGVSQRPGELAGYGPIPAPLARELARDGRWRRVLTDPAGRVVEVSRQTYRPTSAVRRLVQVRDLRCRFPGCSAPARRCDLDHVIAFPDGPTAASNLIALCRRHHMLKHGGRGDQPGDVGTDQAVPTGDAADTMSWRMPDGRSIPNSAPQIGDPTADAELLDQLHPPPDEPG
jgi:Domain of unknown function (DUF222)